MGRTTRLPGWAADILICPSCQGALGVEEPTGLRCGTCDAVYPVIDGKPILIDDANSVFSVADFTRPGDETYYLGHQPSEGRRRGMLPQLSLNRHSRRNYRDFARRLLERSDAPRILVVGGSRLGTGMDELVTNTAVQLLETDVALGPRTQLVCDAQSLPFADSAFDGVIAQAILEHVVDPYRCVAEFHRVLKPRGLVYAETPFMQQVHGGRYDFTRFTHLGYRRLFRDFDELLNEAAAGPGTVLAWSYEFMLLSFVRRSVWRNLVKAFARLTGAWLKYLDVLVMARPGTLDAASAYNFMGAKSDRRLSDRELVASYRGAQQ